MTELFSIGWRPMVIGLVVLLIGAIAGWGMAGDPAFTPVRWLRAWLDRVILPGLKHPSFVRRWAVIFLNNATICAAVIGLGRWRVAAWAGVVLVGLSLGAAIRLLQVADWELHDSADNPGANPDDSANAESAKPVDRLVALGLLLNTLELPAIVIAIGLAMGRVALPNGMLPVEVWSVYAAWVIPLLILAAGGESMWIGRKSPF